MNTFVLSPETANLSVQDLLKRAASDSVQVLDTEGNVVAYVLSPVDREALIYAEAKLDLDRHRDEVQQALSRRGGTTTRQLLDNAKATAQDENSPS